jgi:hypothetical protein
VAAKSWTPPRIPQLTLVDCLAAGSDSKVGRSLPTVPIGGPSGALFAGLFSGTFCELHDFHPTFALLFIYCCNGWVPAFPRLRDDITPWRATMMIDG